MVKLSCLKKNLKLWLSEHEKILKWTTSGIEESAYSLNVMFRSLRNLKANNRPPPRRFRCLETLLNRIYAEESKARKQADGVDEPMLISSPSESEEEEQMGMAKTADDKAAEVDWDNLDKLLVTPAGFAT